MSKHLVLAQVLLLVLQAHRVVDDELHNVPGVREVLDPNCNDLRKEFDGQSDFMLRMKVNMPTFGERPFAFKSLMLSSDMKFELEQTPQGLTLKIVEGSKIQFKLLGPSLKVVGTTTNFASMSGDITAENCEINVVIDRATDAVPVSTIGCKIENFKIENNDNSKIIEKFAGRKGTVNEFFGSVFLGTLQRTLRDILRNLATDEFRAFLATMDLVEGFKATGQVHFKSNDDEIEVHSAEGIQFDFKLTNKGFTQLKENIEHMKRRIAQMLGSTEKGKTLGNEAHSGPTKSGTMLDSVSDFLNAGMKHVFGKKLVAAQSLNIEKDTAARSQGEETRGEGSRVFHSGRLIVDNGNASLAAGCSSQQKGECFEHAASMPFFGNLVMEMLSTSLTHFQRTHDLQEKVLDGKSMWETCKYYAFDNGLWFPIALAQMGKQLLEKLKLMHETDENAELADELKSLSEMTLVSKSKAELILNEKTKAELIVNEGKTVYVTVNVIEFHHALKHSNIYTLAPPGVLV